MAESRQKLHDERLITALKMLMGIDPVWPGVSSIHNRWTGFMTGEIDPANNTYKETLPILGGATLMQRRPGKWKVESGPPYFSNTANRHATYFDDEVALSRIIQRLLMSEDGDPDNIENFVGF